MCFSQGPAPVKNICKLSCWNVSGLKNSAFGYKLNDPDFLNQINECHIISLSEVWGCDDIDVPDFKIVAMSPPMKRNTKRPARCSGGILVAVKNFLTPYVELVKQTPNYIWCRIASNLFQTDKDILLCSVYIPPRDSPYFDPDIFTNLENDINNLKNDYSIVLMGDFNARTGTENDFIVEGLNDFIPHDNFPLPRQVPNRYSFDGHINEHGKTLIEICKSLDLRILNGRCKGDSLGKITFHGSQGISTVDYIITDHETMNIFQNFVVRHPSPFSDHCQLVSWIKVKDSLTLKENTKPTETLFNLPRQYKWNPDSKEKFISALQSTEVQNMISVFEKENLTQIGDINKAVDKFTKIIDAAAKKSLQPVLDKKKFVRHRQSQVWFDKDCKNLRKRLRRISNKKQTYPHDEETRQEYLTVKRQYKSMLQHKRQRYQDTQIQELVKTNDPTQFWSTLKTMSKSASNTADSNVPVDELLTHFQQLHSAPSEETFSKTQETVIEELKHKQQSLLHYNELDNPFTESEIRNGIKKLKNKKAAGTDRIRNEMLKSGGLLLMTSLKRLFNLILDAGMFPDCWSMGLITPIFKLGEKSNPSNYRGICVTSCLGKLFTALLNNRLQNLTKNKNLLHPSQIGFIEGFRTSDHIFSLRTLIDKYVTNANKGKLFCCFVDFQKAFDSIWHDGLLSKLITYKLGGHFYQLISDMYSRSKCAIKCGNRRTQFFNYNRGVRQGCILSPLLFNLYLNDFPFTLDNSRDTDTITLPNGDPLNCLFYADDLVLISQSASGLQKQIDKLQNYVQKWLLKINLRKTKVLIFQKQNRKSTREKYSFFLNGNQIINTPDYTYLGTIFSSNGSFTSSKKSLVEKSRRSVFAFKRYIEFNKLSISKCNFLFNAVFLPVLLYGSEIWGAYDSLNLNKWEKDPIERFHSQFYKSYLCLNRRASNVAARNETGRLPLKLTIFSNTLKFWLHLLNLPTSSVARQCLQISTQLADSGKKCFMLSIYDILKQYGTDFSTDLQTMIDTKGDRLKTKQCQSKIIENFKTGLEMHQHELIRCNKKLKFYSTFKTDVTPSNSLELITNLKHRRAVAKLRVGNHNLRIETGRHSYPKLPEHLRICQNCSSNEIENEEHFVLNCSKYDTIRKSLIDYIVRNYSDFSSLDANQKITFLFNNIDAFLCKKLGYFIHEAFALRNESTIATIVN